MRPRFAAVPVAAALLAGCGHHEAVPHLDRVPPTTMERSFVAQVKSAEPPSKAYAGLIRRAATAARAQAVEVRLVGSAAAVTLAVSDPAPFLKRRLQGFLDRTRLGAQERGGAYLRIVDGHSRRVLEWMITETHGELWIRPDLFECSPIQPISRALGAKYPRCPA